DAAEPEMRIWTALPTGPGDLLNLRDLEQGLENFRRVPTASASIQIEPAAGSDAKPGESDLAVDWRQRLPLRLTLAADDGRSESTGKYQGNVTVSADHWLSLNDLFYFSFHQDLGGGDAGDGGSRGRTLHYSFPLGYWLLAVTDSENDYHQSVAGDRKIVY